MALIKTFITYLLFIMAVSCYAQDKKYDISPPLDINQETGWNKVLCMKNGNTMLFHFEPTKKILVKVFDSSHKEIASRRDVCKTLDEFTIESVVFKGLYDINGEAVLFIDQDKNGKHGLIMLRYNSTDGKLIEDRLVGESKSEDKRLRYYVMQNKDDGSYAILFSMDKRHPKENDMFLVFFNKKHESVREIQLEVDRKKFDYLEIKGAEWQPSGILITVGLDETTMYGKVDHNTAMQTGGSIYEHYLGYYYIPKDDSIPKTKLIDLSVAIFPYYTLYTYNPFAGYINSFLYSYKPIFQQIGQNILSGELSSNIFFRIGKDDMSAAYNVIQNKNANDYLKQHRDTTKFFDGIPIKMFTNENGLSTLISQAETPYGELETRVRYDHQDYFGNIGITQLDDDGNEIWGTLLPLAQYLNSYKHYYTIHSLSKRWQEQIIFGDLPAQVYNRQFVSINTYTKDKNFYVIYNDYDKNFNNTIEKPGDTVYTFTNTNACYYKIDRKKEVTKHYLFGEPAIGEYKCSFIEGAGYDEERGVYAALIQYKKNDKISLHMAWAHLE